MTTMARLTLWMNILSIPILVASLIFSTMTLRNLGWLERRQRGRDR